MAESLVFYKLLITSFVRLTGRVNIKRESVDQC